MSKEVTDVNAGQVELSKGDVALRSLTNACCIAAAACNSRARIGAMDYIMLPGGNGLFSSDLLLLFTSQAYDLLCNLCRHAGIA